MAPVPPRAWGLGVPGESQLTPVPAYSYRLMAGMKAHCSGSKAQACAGVSAARPRSCR